jgi:hypothetical protein
MNKRVLIHAVMGVLALIVGTVAQAQSAYFEAVTNLNPAAYWPLNETTQPPDGQYIATNSGTAGAAGNGYYGSWYQPLANTFYATNHILHTAGTTGDGDTALQCSEVTGAGQYVVIPQTTNGVHNSLVSITAPFTIEAWILTTNVTVSGATANTRGIIGEGHNSVQGGASSFYTNALYGFSLGQYHNYFAFQIYNGKQMANNGAQELDLKNLTANQWYYVVATYDGTTEKLYSNGVMVASAPAAFAPDAVSPLLIGTGTEPSAEDADLEFSGSIDDVAIYNAVLSQDQISAHYAATSGTGYAATVLADNPTFYFRLDEPAFNSSSYPSPATYPVATNYGTLGASANAAYMPGTAPGVAGPPYGGFGPNATAVAINGYYGAVDVGGGALPAALNPTGKQPQTVISWFQGNPVDARFQCIVSHGNNSWRLPLNGQNNPNASAGSTADYDIEFNPGNGPEIGLTNLATEVNNGFLCNDGNWHMAVGVSDGTNAYLYLDGRLAAQTNGVGSLVGTNQDALLGGNPSQTIPNYTTAPNLEYFDGQIAQVAYFTNALSVANIQQLYNAAGIPLTLATQPQSVTNTAGSSASLTIAVSGSAPIYQWYSTNVNTGAVAPVAGQTNASLVFNPVELNNAGYYFVIATNSYTSLTSSVVQLTVVGPPVVLQQSPTDIEVFTGTTPSLAVTIFGPLPLTYQWTSNSVPIAGATATNYAPSTSVLGTTIYSCIVTNIYGAVTNAPNTVTVLAAPTAPYPVQVLADDPVAYYRLNETSGTTAYDYVGGNNAVYTNVLLGDPGYTFLNAVNSDPTETAALFGYYNAPNANSYAGNVPSYLNFGTPNGGNAVFSVEAWITQYAYNAVGDCIVALGYGNGGEQFDLDTGNTATGYLRFSVRNAAGTSYGASSTKAIESDGLWHHVVGVCDEANGHVYLYLDGTLIASNAIPAGSGLLASTTPLSIGARQSGNFNGTNYDFQLDADVDDVAIYNYALSPAQVQAHYVQSGIPPQITGLQPFNVATNAGANVSFTVAASGTPPLVYQWLDNNNNPIPWGTNATLNLTNVQVSQTGTYTVNVTDLYGGPVSTNTHLTVTQVPQIIADVTPTNVVVYATEPTTLSVTVSGSSPLYYQWYQNGAPVPNATNTTYSFPAPLGTNTYYLAVTNAYNAGSPVFSSTATVAGLPIITLMPTNYTDNLKITFAGYNRGETLSDFPVLVRLSTGLAGFNYSHFADPSGGDLRFTDSGGTRVIPYEIDQWNTNGESTVWVQMPTLSGTNDFIVAYWGNPADVTPPDYSTNGAVWVSQALQSLPPYDLVYHLEQNGFPYLDSTLQYPALNGIAPGTTNGIVGSGGSFSRLPYLNAGSVNLGNAFTLSAWVNVSSAVSDIQCIWANGPGVSGSSEAFFYVNDYKTSDGALVLATGNGSTAQNLVAPAGSVSLNQWHLVTAAVNRTNGMAQLYVDGNQVAAGAVRNDFSTNSDMDLGQDTGNTFGFLGLLDESRIHSGLESSNWVWASWMTVAQTASLESYSTVASTVPPPASPVTVQVQFSGGSLNLSGTGGTANATYYVVGSTNLTLPMAQWTVVSTNQFDGSGNFSVGLPVATTNQAQFFSIKQ